jgi:hypothetical protein
LYDATKFNGQGNFKNIDNKDRSWEFTKVLNYSEAKGADSNTSYNCLVEWNDMNKSQSWMNLFSLSLSNSTPIISFARKNVYLNKMLCCHIIQYNKSKPSTIIESIQTFSVKTTGIN